VEDAAGRPVPLFRPPHGIRRAVPQPCCDAGFQHWLWTVDPEDWRGGKRPASRLARSPRGYLRVSHFSTRRVWSNVLTRCMGRRSTMGTTTTWLVYRAKHRISRLPTDGWERHLSVIISLVMPERFIQEANRERQGQSFIIRFLFGALIDDGWPIAAASPGIMLPHKPVARSPIEQCTRSNLGMSRVSTALVAEAAGP